MAESEFGRLPLKLGHSVSRKNFLILSFFLVSFSVLFWSDYFMSIGKTELNPLYSPTNKLIFYPIIIITMVGLFKLHDNRAFKSASIFLVSLFAFAFLWNIGVGYAQTTIINHIDGTHEASGLSGGKLLAQRIDDIAFGNQISSFAWRLGCGSFALPINYGVAEVDGGNTIVQVLYTNSFTLDNIVSSTGRVYFLNITSPVILNIPTPSHHYIIFANHTSPSCVGATNIATLTRSSGVDSTGENALTFNNTYPTSTYIGSAVSALNPTSEYAVNATGNTLQYFNQTATSTCNALNGASCSSTTSSIVFPSGCSSGSLFTANLNHNVQLLNGSTQTQIATATNEYILPSSNQFSNITIIDWTNNTTRVVNMNFTKTNYNSGDTVQARCSLNMNSINSTSGTSTCGLSLTATCVIPNVTTETPTDVLESPFTPITEGNVPELTQQIFNIFLTPFMLFTIIAIMISGYVALAFKEAKEHSGTIFMALFLIFALAFTVIGVYPIFIGVIIILVLCIFLAKMIQGFLKGG